MNITSQIEIPQEKDTVGGVSYAMNDTILKHKQKVKMHKKFWIERK